MIDAFGWTWEYIDEEMTIPRMTAISEYWKTVPPLSITVLNIATFLGVERRTPKKLDRETVSSLFEDMGAMGGAVAPLPQWLKDARALEAANG